MPLRDAMTAEQIKLVSDAEKIYRQYESDRRPYEKRWNLNISFLDGSQWLGISETDRDNVRLLPVPGIGEDEKQFTTNYIMSNYVFAMARYVKAEPETIVVPGERGQTYIDAAKSAEVLLDKIKYLNDTRIYKIYHAFWTLACGNSFDLITYDKSKGIPLDKGINTGDVQLELLNPYEIYADDSIPLLEHQRRIVIARVIPVDVVEKVYGVKVPPDHIQPRGYRGVNFIGGQIVSDTQEDSDNSMKSEDDTVYVKTMLEKASPSYPDGRSVVWTGGHLLRTGPMPFKNKSKYPIVHRRFFWMGTRFWARDFITDLIQPQTEYNVVTTQSIDDKDTFIRKKWVDYKESGLTKGDFAAENNYLKCNTKAATPEILESLHMNEAYVTSHLARAKEQIEEMAKVNSASKGTPPPGVKSGVALNFLLERDEDAYLGPFTLLEYAVEQRDQQILERAREFYKEKRVIGDIGYDTSFDPRDFLISDLHKNARIKVMAGSGVPKSRAAKIQLGLDMAERGFFNSPMTGALDQKLFARYMDIEGLVEIVDHYDVDGKRARREHDELLNGARPIILQYDDHMIHFTEHRTWMLQPLFMELPQQMQDAMMEHLQQHEQALAQAQTQNAPTSPPK